ncbi:hypothetical protein Q5752_000814 [Cryptotrichosporon argae]
MSDQPEEYTQQPMLPQTPTWSGLLQHDVDPSHVLLPASSTTSLASLASNQSYPLTAPLYTVDHSYLPTPALMSAFPAIVPSQHDKALPPLQTNGFGPVPGRQRNASRALPYSRSSSISMKEDEDMGQLMSSISTHSYTPWSDASSMSLGHGRTFSTDSTGYRARSLSRQASLSFLEDDMQLRGTPAERQVAVQQDLAETANKVKSIVSAGQQDKARALWVKRWLRLSYSWFNGSTVPRQGLYHSYAATCTEHGLRPINSASFGKIVRATFPGIKTRRLGVRGNSKYHYVAIRPSIPIEAEKLNAYGDSSGQLHVASTEDSEENSEEDEDDDVGALMERRDFPDPFATRPMISTGRSRSTSVDETKTQRPIFARRHTTSAPTIALPTPISAAPLLPRPLPQLPADASYYPRLAQHRQELANAVWDLDWARYEMLCRSYWGSENPVYCPKGTVLDVLRGSYDHSLQLLLDRLNEPIAPVTHQALVTFGLTVQNVLRESTTMMPADTSSEIVELTGHFGSLVVRYAQLHQITASLVPILATRMQLDSMLLAWTRIDVPALIAGSAAVCGCNPTLLGGVFDAFYGWLSADASVYGLCNWAEGLLDQVFGHVGMSAVPRVTYVTSQVMRELTLCSDPSFGYFHLIKTWTDDYIAMTVQRRTAFAQPAATWIVPGQTDASALTPRPF